MEAGDRVRVITFSGGLSAPPDTDSKENYWLLIGENGTIVQDPNERTFRASFSVEPRVLVRFDNDILAMNLHCHNTVPNALLDIGIRPYRFNSEPGP